MSSILLDETDDEAAQPDVKNALSRDMWREVASLITTIEVPLQSGGSFSWHISLPSLLIPRLATAPGSRWAEKFWSYMQQKPCSSERPWDLLLYHDDIGVGNALKADNRRTQLAMYASFAEFGEFLGHEEAWLPLGVVPADIKKESSGSAITRALLRRMFLGDGDSGFAVHGHVFYYRLRRFIADDLAGKETFQYKGASGWRCCVHCKNVCSLQGDGTLADWDDSGYIVPISCAEPDRFDRQTSAEYVSAYDDLTAVRDDPRSTANAFEEMDPSGVGKARPQPLSTRVAGSSTHRFPAKIL